ncbi:MAG: hypothetical protein GDA52_06765 [Rhodobacteraceae bacterium]|nr:hypothetical protein [Paracoccaceae bacterium]
MKHLLKSALAALAMTTAAQAEGTITTTAAQQQDVTSFERERTWLCFDRLRGNSQPEIALTDRLLFGTDLGLGTVTVDGQDPIDAVVMPDPQIFGAPRQVWVGTILRNGKTETFTVKMDVEDGEAEWHEGVVSFTPISTFNCSRSQ